MNFLERIPRGMTFDELHEHVGGSKDYLWAVMNGWASKPGLKIILKIAAVCPRIKPSMFRPELRGLK